MKERSGMPYDVVAFENDELALALTPEEEGIFHRMIRRAWMNGSVPADLTDLAHLCRVNPRTMRKAWGRLSLMWVPMDGNPLRIISKKLESERKYLEYKRNLSQIAGKASAKARETKKRKSTDVQQTGSTSLPSPSLPNKEDSNTYGEFGNVRLTKSQHEKLDAKMNVTLPSLIDRLDRWGEEEPAKFRKKKSHYATMLNWYDKDVKDGKIVPADAKPQKRKPPSIFDTL